MNKIKYINIRSWEDEDYDVREDWEEYVEGNYIEIEDDEPVEFDEMWGC